MNWRRLCAVIQICMVVGGAAVVGAIFWAMVVTGICRIAFGLDEDRAMLYVFVPLCVAIAVCLIRFLPKRLRKAGMLSDEPKKFGPWFTP
jgi:hypothetical protein